MESGIRDRLNDMFVLWVCEHLLITSGTSTTFFSLFLEMVRVWPSTQFSVDCSKATWDNRKNKFSRTTHSKQHTWKCHKNFKSRYAGENLSFFSLPGVCNTEWTLIWGRLKVFFLLACGLKKIFSSSFPAHLHNWRSGRSLMAISLHSLSLIIVNSSSANFYEMDVNLLASSLTSSLKISIIFDDKSSIATREIFIGTARARTCNTAKNWPTWSRTSPSSIFGGYKTFPNTFWATCIFICLSLNARSSTRDNNECGRWPQMTKTTTILIRQLLRSIARIRGKLGGFCKLRQRLREFHIYYQFLRVFFSVNIYLFMISFAFFSSLMVSFLGELTLRLRQNKTANRELVHRTEQQVVWQRTIGRELCWAGTEEGRRMLS